MFQILKSLAMLVTVVFLTTFFAVSDAYAEDFICNLNIVDDSCAHTIKTGEKITAFLDGQEQSVTVKGIDESSDYGTTLQVFIDDEKEPDLTARPDGQFIYTYKSPYARKLVVENKSQNYGVPAKVYIKENDAEDTADFLIFNPDYRF